MRSNVAELRAGRGSLNILFLISEAYYGVLSGVSGNSPEERIRDPATVADMLVKCVAAGLRNGTHDESLVSPLLLDQDHAGVAHLAALPLLQRFPPRCTVPQLGILDRLLHTALRYVDGPCFLGLIAERLSRTSMTVAQRVHWLAMGVIAAPDTYLEQLQELVQRRERRITHLVNFLATAGPDIEGLRAPALKYLIGLLGSTVGRWPAHDSYAQSMRLGSASSCVYRMIQRLAILPEPDAGAALNELASETALSSWHATLNRAGEPAARTSARRRLSVRVIDVSAPPR